LDASGKRDSKKKGKTLAAHIEKGGVHFIFMGRIFSVHLSRVKNMLNGGEKGGCSAIPRRNNVKRELVIHYLGKSRPSAQRL